MLGPGRRRLRARGIDHDVGAELFGKRAAGRRIICRDDRVQALIFSAAITASPTGPQPITSGTSPPLILALATAWTPTASGSVSAACSAARPLGTSSNSASLEQHALGIGAEIVV